MSKHERTLEAVFKHPTPANLAWRDIEALLRHLGTDISEGSGSRIRAELKGVKAVFHRPHPEPQASRPQVRAVAAFLAAAGMEP